ncbi:hypothetical protein VM98_33690, partial [Streptomyces rubellomurinus subsp. indigoferus]
AWEALNNIAEARDRPLVIVVNDNERSYARTIGGIANNLATLRTIQGYERFLSWGKEAVQRTAMVGQPIFDAVHGSLRWTSDGRPAGYRSGGR